jgi:hypothetical protein
MKKNKKKHNDIRSNKYMSIDIKNSGYTMCISRTQTQQPHDKDTIWKPEEGTGEQMFNSIKTLYAPEGQQVDSSEIPFVEMR